MSTNNSINSGSGSTGSVLIGNTGAAPSFSATPSVTSISIANAPSASTDGTNKAYVDAIAAGFNFKNSCYASTTGALTASYLNGAAGVGATLTNTDTLAAFSIDGQSPSLGARVLIKNQGSDFQNGIYTVTVVGSGAVAWILTRATDFDQPSEIQPGDIVPVEFGTANANTLWLQTSAVTLIGTDSITFTQFLGNGIKTITGDTGGPLSGSNITFTGGSTGLSFGGSGTTETLSFAGITANGGNVNLSTDDVNQTIEIGTGNALKLVYLGTTSGNSATTIRAGAQGVFIDGQAGGVNFLSGLVFTNTVTATTPYQPGAADYFIGIDSSGGARSVQLPNAPTAGRAFVIKDSTGSAATHNITVTTVGGVVNIDGAATFVMNTAYESINVIFDGTSYEIY